MNISLHRYNDLAHAFMYKCMECVLENRCPAQVPDFRREEHHWFALSIPRSDALRERVGIAADHGWFRISVCLRAADAAPEIVEQWYLFHLPQRAAELCADAGADGRKQQTYRCFAQALRALYSVINALPMATLLIALRDLQMAKPPQVYAEISGFTRFPAKMERFCEEETSKVQFGTVSTPTGRVSVVCKYRVDLMPLLPRPIRTAPHAGAREARRERRGSAREEETVGMSVPHSFEYMRTGGGVCDTPPMSFVPSDAEPMRFEQPIGEVQTVDEFIGFLEGLPESLPVESAGIEDVRRELQAVRRQLERVAQE